MSETNSTLDRYANALGDAVLVALALFVVFGQDWLTTNGYTDLSAGLAVVLVVLAWIAVIPDARDLVRRYR